MCHNFLNLKVGVRALTQKRTNWLRGLGGEGVHCDVKFRETPITKENISFQALNFRFGLPIPNIFSYDFT